MNKEIAQQFCQSGGIEVLREVIREIIDKTPSVEFDPNPQRLSYNVGRRDGAEEALVEIVDYITKSSRE